MIRAAAVVALLSCVAGAALAQGAPPSVVIEHTSIERTSARKSKSGDFLPPFTSAKVHVGWQKKPFAAGGKATVLPLDPKLPPVTVAITQVKLLPMGNQCTGEKPLWEMTAAAIRTPAILGARPLRAPSGAVAVPVIAPRLEAARGNALASAESM